MRIYKSHRYCLSSITIFLSFFEIPTTIRATERLFLISIQQRLMPPFGRKVQLTFQTQKDVNHSSNQKLRHKNTKTTFKKYLLHQRRGPSQHPEGKLTLQMRFKEPQYWKGSSRKLFSKQVELVLESKTFQITDTCSTIHTSSCLVRDFWNITPLKTRASSGDDKRLLRVLLTDDKWNGNVYGRILSISDKTPERRNF